MSSTISQTDKDLNVAINFLISIASIFEEMTRDLIKNPGMGINYTAYSNKIRKYAPTYEGIVNDFHDSIFGEFSNRATMEEFKIRLTADGWKYFNLTNLNELFAIMLEKHGMLKDMETELPTFDEAVPMTDLIASSELR